MQKVTSSASMKKALSTENGDLSFKDIVTREKKKQRQEDCNEAALFLNFLVLNNQLLDTGRHGKDIPVSGANIRTGHTSALTSPQPAASDSESRPEHRSRALIVPRQRKEALSTYQTILSDHARTQTTPATPASAIAADRARGLQELNVSVAGSSRQTTGVQAETAALSVADNSLSALAMQAARAVTSQSYSQKRHESIQKTSPGMIASFQLPDGVNLARQIDMPTTPASEKPSPAFQAFARAGRSDGQRDIKTVQGPDALRLIYHFQRWTGTHSVGVTARPQEGGYKNHFNFYPSDSRAADALYSQAGGLGNNISIITHPDGEEDEGGATSQHQQDMQDEEQQ